MYTPIRNPIAKSLSSPHLKPQIVKPKKGKGSYTRKERKEDGDIES